MTNPQYGDNPLSNAQALAAAGFNVLPARYGQKAPMIPWANYRSRRSDQMLVQWFDSSPAAKINYWVMTGLMSGIVVIDTDNEAGDRWWRDLLGDDLLDSTACVRSANGHHYYFRIPQGHTTAIQSFSATPEIRANGGPSWDFRADGTGIIVPPSVHHTGHRYAWVRDLQHLVDAPPSLLDGSLRPDTGGSGASGAEGTRKGTDGVVRSMLSSLLKSPPTSKGSRNNWLISVAGHYAKQYHRQEDLFRVHCEAASRLIDPPLDPAEVEKTIQSAWDREHENHPERALDGDCGWLKGNGTRLFTQVKVKKGEEATVDLAEYANFDAVAKGVMLSEDKSRTYWVRLVKRKQDDSLEEIDAILPGATLGDDRALRKWLARFGCTVLAPSNMYPREGGPGLRIQRYLDSQEPPAVTVTKTLGWDPDILDGQGGFITHDGVITAQAVISTEDAGVRPDPALLVGKVAPHAYGFEADLTEARRVLSEVMTFHQEHATAVFGAWWAACLVKPQIEARTALFPFMAVEAPSESGKTNGFFDLMTQLNGNTRGEIQPTKAALRDMAASHRNGIVWVDDLDDLGYLMELLRAATSGGSLAKMGEDRESVKNTRIVAPIVVSGEALGLGTQKALLDRAIILKVGSPTDRRSLHDPNRPQWDDVLALREQYPAARGGLSAVAGWLVQQALEATPQVLRALSSGKKGVAGRAADKVAILRAGARLMDSLLSSDDKGREAAWAGRGSVARRVEQWVEYDTEHGAGSDENTLTLRVLPWALRTFGYPEKALAGDPSKRQLDAPVFMREDSGTRIGRLVQATLGEEVPETGNVEVWFNTGLLAQAWEQAKHGRVERRTETEDAMKDQADALSARAKRFKIVGGGGRLAYYRKVEGDLARRVLARARGGDEP